MVIILYGSDIMIMSRYIMLHVVGGRLMLRLLRRGHARLLRIDSDNVHREAY